MQNQFLVLLFVGIFSVILDLSRCFYLINVGNEVFALWGDFVPGTSRFLSCLASSNELYFGVNEMPLRKYAGPDL